MNHFFYPLIFVTICIAACQNPPLREDQAVVELKYTDWKESWVSKNKVEYEKTKRIIKTPEEPFYFHKISKKDSDTRIQTEDFDTLAARKQLSMYNQPYELQLRKFCLNDSSVYKKWKMPTCGSMIYHSHDYATQLLLHQDTTLVLDAVLTKSTFKDSLLAHLDEKAFKAMTLRNVEYGFVRSNRLYFNAYFHYVIAHDESEEVLTKIQFAIFYQTKKKGELACWGLESIPKEGE